jgi:hypothetical protein
VRRELCQLFWGGGLRCKVCSLPIVCEPLIRDMAEQLRAAQEERSTRERQTKNDVMFDSALVYLKQQGVLWAEIDQHLIKRLLLQCSKEDVAVTLRGVRAATGPSADAATLNAELADWV